VFRYLKHQGVAGGKPEGEYPGKEKPQFFEPAAEMGVCGSERFRTR